MLPCDVLRGDVRENLVMARVVHEDFSQTPNVAIPRDCDTSMWVVVHRDPTILMQILLQLVSQDLEWGRLALLRGESRENHMR